MPKKGGKKGGKKGAKEKKTSDFKDDRVFKDKVSNFEKYIQRVSDNYYEINNELDEEMDRFKSAFRGRLAATKESLYDAVPKERLLKAQKNIDDIYDFVTPMVVSLLNQIEFHMSSTRTMLHSYRMVEHKHALLNRKLLWEYYIIWSSVIKEENARHHAQMARPEVHALRVRITDHLLRSYLNGWREILRTMRLLDG